MTATYKAEKESLRKRDVPPEEGDWFDVMAAMWRKVFDHHWDPKWESSWKEIWEENWETFWKICLESEGKQVEESQEAAEFKNNLEEKMEMFLRENLRKKLQSHFESTAWVAMRGRT